MYLANLYGGIYPFRKRVIHQFIKVEDKEYSGTFLEKRIYWREHKAGKLVPIIESRDRWTLASD